MYTKSYMDNIIESFTQSLNEIMTLQDLDNIKLGEALDIDPSIVRKWRFKGKDVRRKTLIKLADYFHCSIEYLCGKTTEYIKVEPQLSYPNFGERLTAVMAETKTRPSQLFRGIHIDHSLYYYWLNGGEPNLTSLETLAEFFGVTLDYLVGREISNKS